MVSVACVWPLRPTADWFDDCEPLKLRMKGEKDGANYRGYQANFYLPPLNKFTTGILHKRQLFQSGLPSVSLVYFKWKQNTFGSVVERI